MSFYPFVKCLCPRKIHNSFSKEDLLIPCGHCEACLIRKSSINTLRVQMESQKHLYCRFITLTYDNDHIPRMYMQPNEEGNYDLIDSDYHYLLGTWSSFRMDDYIDICNKCECENPPFLRKYDLQLFFKRLRKYFDDQSKKYNIPYGKIRYFACGEYGPKHFRPHYHIILWTSCDQIITEIGEAVLACWKLGRVSTEKPFHDVSKYVAQYVNGSCPLPSLFKMPETRPFSVHSLHLGESFFQAAKREIYESSFDEIVSRSLFVSNTYTDVSMWWSLKTYYFPRCKEYNLFTTQQRYEAYTLITRLYKKYPEYKTEKLSTFTEFLLRVLNDHIERFGYIPDPFLNDLAKYCNHTFYSNNYEHPPTYEQVYRSLYMILRLSKHFIDICCDGNDSYFNTHKMLDKIEWFWKENELHLMNDRYSNIQENFDELFDDEEEYKLVFSLDPDKVCSTNVFLRFRSDRKNQYLNSMKHKEQNDLNRIFEYK